MNHEFDVVVAGGGPAGSSTANFLRQRQRSVLVLEREQFPRFHIGESMLPFSNDVWRELGVFDKLDAQLHPQAGRQVHPRRVGRRVHLLLRQVDPPRQSLRVPGQARRLRQDAPRPRRRARRRRARKRRASTTSTFAADGVTVRATGPDGDSYDGARRRVRRRHRPRRAHRRPPPAQDRRRRHHHQRRRPHDVQGRRSLAGRRRRQHRHRPVRRRLVVDDPVQGRRHLGRHRLREVVHQGQPRAVARRS